MSIQIIDLEKHKNNLYAVTLSNWEIILENGKTFLLDTVYGETVTRADNTEIVIETTVLDINFFNQFLNKAHIKKINQIVKATSIDSNSALDTTFVISYSNARISEIYNYTTCENNITRYEIRILCT